METKLRLIGLLESNQGGVHLRELSRLLGTGFPNLVRYVNILDKENVITKFKDANTIKVKLRENQRTIAYLKQLNTERFLALPKKVQLGTDDFLKGLTIKPLIAILFGSYAHGNQAAGSDIDLLLVFQESKNEKDMDNLAQRISMMTNTKISPIYLDYASFERNFLDKRHDFSKEIRQSVIVLLGVEHYYQLLWRFLE